MKLYSKLFKSIHISLYSGFLESLFMKFFSNLFQNIHTNLYSHLLTTVFINHYSKLFTNVTINHYSEPIMCFRAGRHLRFVFLNIRCNDLCTFRACRATIVMSNTTDWIVFIRSLSTVICWNIGIYLPYVHCKNAVGLRIVNKVSECPYESWRRIRVTRRERERLHFNLSWKTTHVSQTLPL